MAKPPESGRSLFDFTIDEEGLRTLRVVADLPQRIAAVKRMLIWHIADAVMISVIGKLPNQDQYQKISNNLTVASVTGVDASFAIHVKQTAKRVRKIDGAKTVLYVRAKKGATRSPSIITEVLENMGPWTIDTIPFWPSKKHAVVVQRKVKKAQVERVANMQEKQKAKVRAALAKFGRKLKNPDEKRKRNGEKAIEDLAMVALNLEFGNGDVRAVPAWRTSILDIPNQVKAAFRDRSQIIGALTDPSDRRWKTWPRVKDKVGRSQVKSYINFMKRIIG